MWSYITYADRSWNVMLIIHSTQRFYSASIMNHLIMASSSSPSVQIIMSRLLKDVNLNKTPSWQAKVTSKITMGYTWSICQYWLSNSFVSCFSSSPSFITGYSPSQPQLQPSSPHLLLHCRVYFITWSTYCCIHSLLLHDIVRKQVALLHFMKQSDIF